MHYKKTKEKEKIFRQSISPYAETGDATKLMKHTDQTHCISMIVICDMISGQ